MSSSLHDALGCPCTELPPADPESIMERYRQARERGAREGFWPILVPREDDILSECLEINTEPDAAAYRRKLLAEPVRDAAALFAERTRCFRESYAEAGLEWPDPEILDGWEDSPANCQFSGILDFRSSVPKTVPLLLAEIPAKHPWEVFAWLPFGGWNECPAAEEQMAAAKYWHEKYGAVPAVITHDVLEYVLPAPPPAEAVLDLTLEQFTFCTDIVEQGCGTIGALAGILSKSTVWFFWWD